MQWFRVVYRGIPHARFSCILSAVVYRGIHYMKYLRDNGGRICQLLLLLKLSSSLPSSSVLAFFFSWYGTYFPSGGIEKGQRIGRYYTERIQWPSDLYWSRPVRELRGHWIEVSLHPNPQKMITIWGQLFSSFNGSLLIIELLFNIRTITLLAPTGNVQA